MNASTRKFLAVLWVVLVVIVEVTQAQQSLQITSARARQDTDGLYKINLLFNEQADSNKVKLIDDLKDIENYVLLEGNSSTETFLSEAPTVGGKNGFFVVILSKVGLTWRKQYTIAFKPAGMNATAPVSVTFRAGEGTDAYESNRDKPWRRSIEPKLAQGASTISSIGDIGVDLAFSKELPRDFEFEFDASLTLNKDDPNNHWNLDFYWRPIDLLMHNSGKIGIRPLSLSVQENATQALRFHDISARAITSLFFHPVDGLQPVFVTVGLDEALRVNFDGEEFDDPRLSIEVQWGMIGLLGTGSSFFVQWQFWRRFNNLGDPRIDPTQDKQRQMIQLEFVLPVMNDKNLTLKYADGEMAPTFIDDTNVQVGLEFFFGGRKIWSSKQGQ